MIYADSRYADGSFLKAFDSKTKVFYTTVLRNFPTGSSDFFYYSWVAGDRIDVIAHKILGSSDFWYKIMDVNPEIIDPMNIEPGTVIRVPNV
jgi:hypothetical protein